MLINNKCQNGASSVSVCCYCCWTHSLWCTVLLKNCVEQSIGYEFGEERLFLSEVGEQSEKGGVIFYALCLLDMIFWLNVILVKENAFELRMSLWDYALWENAQCSLIICITDLIRIYFAKCLQVGECDGGHYAGHFPLWSQWIAFYLCLEMVAHSLPAFK